MFKGMRLTFCATKDVEVLGSESPNLRNSNIFPCSMLHIRLHCVFFSLKICIIQSTSFFTRDSAGRNKCDASVIFGKII